MINLIVWIIAGALIGWAASLIMKTDSRQGLIADIIVGIVGSFVGGYFLSPIFNVSTINEGNFSIPALLISLGGAILLLVIFKLVRNIGGCLVILIGAVILYLYFTCWSIESSSAFCIALRALPFLP